MIKDRKLLWKLDLRLIPWLCLLYLISFLDRTNIGNAKLDGLQKSLNITGGQYNACLTIFFVSYALFEPLTNILLKRLRPSVFIPAIMVLWGIVMVTMGLTHDFSGMMAARFFLGLAEAGKIPSFLCLFALQAHPIQTYLLTLSIHRSLPRNQLLPFMLVQARRIRNPRRHLLQRSRSFRLLWRTPRSRHRSDDRRRRQRRLGLDLHSRRFSHRPDRNRIRMDGI